MNQNTLFMNHVTKRNRLQQLQNGYDAVLEFTTGVSRIKLMEEILKIDNEIKCINQMTLSQLHKEVDSYFISVPSKINKQHENKIKS